MAKIAAEGLFDGACVAVGFLSTFSGLFDPSLWHWLGLRYLRRSRVEGRDFVLRAATQVLSMCLVVIEE